MCNPKGSFKITDCRNFNLIFEKPAIADQT